MASLSPEMGGTCTLGADGIYYPTLELPEEETQDHRHHRVEMTHVKSGSPFYPTPPKKGQEKIS